MNLSLNKTLHIAGVALFAGNVSSGIASRLLPRVQISGSNTATQLSHVTCEQESSRKGKRETTNDLP